MAAKGLIAVLAGYFNHGTGVSLDGNSVPEKRSLPAFRDEIKALTDAEKLELAQGVCAITGDTLTVSK